MASIWDQFYELSHLSIGYSNVIGQRANIYGNKKNQVEVVIKLIVFDSNGKPLAISGGDLADKLYLCDYQTGRRLKEPWIISEYPTPFLRPVVHVSPRSLPAEARRDNSFFSRYLACSEGNFEASFSVGINVPGVGEFDTSKDGTATKNGPKGQTGSVFVRPSYLDIVTLPAINYGEPDNIRVLGMPTVIGDFTKLVEDVFVYNTVTYEKKYNGVSSKLEFLIKPRLDGYRFQLGDPVRNRATLQNVKFHSDSNPDMVRGTPGSNYDVQFVFVNQKKNGVLPDSFFMLKNSSGGRLKYTIGNEDERHHWDNTPEYGVVTVHVANHRVPEAGLDKVEWKDMGTKIEVKVTDEYGNEGTIRIESPGNHEKWPQFHVNGVYHA